MDFLSFVRALSLEPVDESVITQMIGSVRFQGNLIDPHELGPEMTDSLTRLLGSEHVDFEDIEEMEEREGNEVNLFENIMLPEISPAHYVQRRLEHNVVLLTKSGSNWRALERELIRRMKEVEDEDLGSREIFAISWASSPNGGSGDYGSGEESLFHHEKVEENGDEASCDSELLKVSDLLEWAIKTGYADKTIAMDVDQDVRNDENMELDNVNFNNPFSDSDVYMKAFLDPWGKLPGNAKLRMIDLDEVEKPEVQFKSLCHIASFFTVHWLQAFRKGGFIWKKTFGPLKISRIKLNTISYQEDKWFPYLEHKAWQNVICISGIAGMGKSTFLANLAHELKKNYKHRLVCYIDLQRFSDIIDAMSLTKMNILQFPNAILTYFNISTDLEHNIFKTLMSAFNKDECKMELTLELLLDGLDKMSKTSRNLIIQFLKDELSLGGKWCYRIWLTTRPHLKYKIEEAFSIVAYDLDSMNSTDVVQYFVMCNDNINLEKIKEVENIATSFFSSSLKAHLKFDLGTMLGTPERMISFQALMKQNDYPDPFKLNAYQVMRNVIMESVKRSYVKNYLSETINEKDNMRTADKISANHIPLAIQACSGDNEGPTEGIQVIAGLSLQEETDLLNFGIITKNKEGKLHFIHSAFPAYILTEYYRESVPDNCINSDFFLNYVLVRDSCDPIRQFLEDSLEKGITDYLSTEWMNLTRNFLIKTYFLSNNVFDHDSVAMNTSVLQLAIIDQRPKLAKLLLRSFAPNHTLECRRLIKRKVRVQLSDMRQYVKNNKLVKSHNNKMVKPSTCNGTKVTKNGNGQQIQQYIELSALSVAVLLGDRELVHSMYLILKNEGDSHLGQFNKSDNFHFSALHLAVIGCNQDTFNYLTTFRKMSPNCVDSRGYYPIHLLFFNRWILKFPSMGLRNLEIESEIVREVHICKYYEDKLDPEWHERVGLVPDRAGHLPLLSSGFLMGYTKTQMKRSLNFSYKRSSQPWKICYYESYQTYIFLAKSLSGRTFINFMEKVEGIAGEVPPPFHMACGTGYLPMIKAMLDKRVNLNIRDKHNRTALITALCKEQMHVVQYLVERGIDRDTSEPINGIPLLHHLSIQNLSTAISYLVQELKVPVDQRHSEMDNCTGLHMACLGGCMEAAETLIELGANVNAKDDEQYTPLLHAAHPTANCNLDLVRLLISKGADLNAGIESEEGRTCLHQAVLTKNLPLIQCLLKYGKDTLNVNATTFKGQSALHLACKKKGNKDILMALVNGGAKVELLDAMGQTPLFIFCAENFTDTAMALYLIKQGAGVFQVNDSGQSLLRQINKRNPVLGELIYGAWKTIKENQEKRNKAKRFIRRKRDELSK